MSIFYPSQYVDSVLSINFELLKKQGITLLLFDVDNTLETYITKEPGEKTKSMFEKLKELDFRIVLVSNGREQRVKSYAAQLGVKYIYKAAKPIPTAMKNAMVMFKAKPSQTAMIGDQIFTDVLGGNLAGAYSILTEPISRVDDEWITRIKRGVEKLVVKSYLKKEGKKNE